jgi:hypothetical protein
MNSLQVLKNNRDALLLAEVVALLHDVGKLSTQFIDQMSTEPSPLSQNFEHENAVERLSSFVDAQFVDVLRQPRLRDLLHFTQILSHEQIGQPLDLILHHDSRRHSSFLIRLLNRCDSADSGTDKGTTRNQGLPKGAKQPFNETFIATAFGSETPASRIDTTKIDTVRRNLSSAVVAILTQSGLKRTEIIQAVQAAYQYGLGETRRSANDVTLWEHSFSVATLYKTALATFLVRGGLDIDNLHWRLLRINFDVLGLYSKAVKIADLLGYQRAVDEACERVKQLVEIEYPLGNEVYRDTTGIYFTFPDLDLPADLEQEIRRRVEGVEPELAPRIAVTQGTGATATEQLREILAKARGEARQALAQPFDDQNLSTQWQQQWETVGAGKGEVCPICRLRPMQEGQEGCEHCENRRGSRVEAWQKDPQHTIWMDELADANGRVALVVGKFGLEDWLSGDLVQTMLVRAKANAPDQCVPKNPSPARLRRVWETGRRFWTETVKREILARHDYSQGDATRCARWQIIPIPDQKTGWNANVPYDGTVNGKPISLFWQERDQCFITISNLQWVGEIKGGEQITVADPDDPSRKITFTVQKVMPAPGDIGAYVPYLSLLASPDQFLALVPAADALEIAKEICDEYEKQFGKVRNRLPLFLGIIFFPRKMPLLAVMDTARRMFETPLGEELWEIAQVESGGQVRFKNGLVWTMPTLMGDRTTPDEWYPYCFVGTINPTQHTRCFQLRREGDNDPRKVGSVSDRYANRWLVHVNDLRAGDTVYVTPSRFAYLWLEHTAQRFAFDPARDVFLLEELPRLSQMWDALKRSGITMTSLHGVWALLESKKASWGTGQELDRLVQTTLKEAGLSDRRDPSNNPLPDIVTPKDVCSGRFFRCLELYLRILKQKV